MSFRNLDSSDLGRKTLSSETLAKQICLTAIQECMIKGQSQHVFTMFWWRSHNLRPLIKEVLSCRSHLWTHPIYRFVTLNLLKPPKPRKIVEVIPFQLVSSRCRHGSTGPTVAGTTRGHTWKRWNLQFSHRWPSCLGKWWSFPKIAVSPRFAGKSCLRPLGKGVDRDFFFDFGAYFLKRWGHKRSLKVMRPSVWRYIIIVELWLYSR